MERLRRSRATGSSTRRTLSVRATGERKGPVQVLVPSDNPTANTVTVIFSCPLRHAFQKQAQSGRDSSFENSQIPDFTVHILETTELTIRRVTRARDIGHTPSVVTVRCRQFVQRALLDLGQRSPRGAAQNSEPRGAV